MVTEVQAGRIPNSTLNTTCSSCSPKSRTHIGCCFIGRVHGEGRSQGRAFAARSLRLAMLDEDSDGDIGLDAQAAGEAHVALEVGARDELALDVGRRTRLTIALDAHAAAAAGALAAAGGGDILARLPPGLEDALPVLYGDPPSARQEGHGVRTLQWLGGPVQVQHDALARLRRRVAHVAVILRLTVRRIALRKQALHLGFQRGPRLRLALDSGFRARYSRLRRDQSRFRFRS